MAHLASAYDAVMGMHGVLCRVSDRQLARIRADDRRAGWLVTGRGPVRSKPWRRLELGKSWDALDKGLAAGTRTGPLADVIGGLGGASLGPSLSFGRPRYLTPAQVAACADALSRFPEQTLRDRYARGDMRGAHGDWGPRAMDHEARGYLADMDRQTDREELEALVGLAHAVTRFYAKASRRADGMLVAVL
jgi:hypothetical protein